MVEINSIFGAAGHVIGPIVDELAREAATPRTYQWMSEVEFSELLDLAQRGRAPAMIANLNRVCLVEILQRAHIAALSNAARHQRWLRGAEAACNEANFLMFAACLRGLLESAGDSLHSLSAVAITLAENVKTIKRAVKGEMNDALVIGSDLENALIHFQFAGRPKKPDQPLPFHRAETLRIYIESLDKDKNGKALNLYEELCGLAHPAHESLDWLRLIEPDADTGTFRAADRRAIKDLVARHHAIVEHAILAAANSSLLILKVLNALPLRYLHVPCVDTIDMSNIPAWGRILAALKSG